MTLSSSGQIVYRGTTMNGGMYTDDTNFFMNASVIAKTFSMSQLWVLNNYASTVNQVHALNPNFKALVYRNVMSIYQSWTSEWNYANSQGWLLKDSSGHYVVETGYGTNFLVDITNSSFQVWVANTVESWLTKYPFYDGVMADNGIKYSAQEFNSYGNSTPINPSTGLPFTDQQLWDGSAGILNAIIDHIGTGKVLVANGVWTGSVWNSSSGNGYRYILSHVPRLNGLMSEGTFHDYSNQWYSESRWLSSVNMMIWMQNNFVNDSNKFFVAACSANPLPTAATPAQVLMYGFCSMLLAASRLSHNNLYVHLDFSKDAADLQLVQRLYGLDIGTPLDSFSKITSGSIYIRDFVFGKVLVNPSTADYSVSISGNYTNFFDNSLVSGSMMVSAHTGVILLAR